MFSFGTFGPWDTIRPKKKKKAAFKKALLFFIHHLSKQTCSIQKEASSDFISSKQTLLFSMLLLSLLSLHLPNNPLEASPDMMLMHFLPEYVKETICQE